MLNDIGIYGFKINDKWYIGSSTKLQERMKHHKNSVTGGNHKDKEIREYYEKHNDFEIKILHELTTEKDLEAWENYYIGLYNAIENGFNRMISRKNRYNHISSNVVENIIGNDVEIWTSKDICDFLKLHAKENEIEEIKEIPCIEIIKDEKRYLKHIFLLWLRNIEVKKSEL